VKLGGHLNGDKEFYSGELQGALTFGETWVQ
jgi:hypothetical protein